MHGFCLIRLTASKPDVWTRFWLAGACVVLLYDHLLTLDDEIQYVWKTKTTVPKVLFLLNRYFVPIVMIVNMYGS